MHPHAPVCRGGCHESIRDSADRVHNTTQVQEEPPRRSIVLQQPSDYSQLTSSQGEPR